MGANEELGWEEQKPFKFTVTIEIVEILPKNIGLLNFKKADKHT